MEEVSGDNLVDYDRKCRPFMKLGPLAWWLAGLAAGSVVIVIVVTKFSPPLHSPPGGGWE